MGGADILTSPKPSFTWSTAPMTGIYSARKGIRENPCQGNGGFIAAVTETTGPQPVQTFSQIYNMKLPYWNEPPGDSKN